MTTQRDHFEACLGKDIRDLIPLIGEALVALDKPGTRALRRKIDKEFHGVVWGYGSLRLCTVDESDWDALRPTLPRYERVTDRWPAQQAHDARKAREAQAAEVALPAVPSIDTRAPTSGLRLVVDNVTRTRRAPPIASPVPGGAA